MYFVYAGGFGPRSLPHKKWGFRAPNQIVHCFRAAAADPEWVVKRKESRTPNKGERVKKKEAKKNQNLPPTRRGLAGQ